MSNQQRSFFHWSEGWQNRWQKIVQFSSHSHSTFVIWISAIVFSLKLIDSCDTNFHNHVNQFINLTISCFSLYILRVTIFHMIFFSEDNISKLITDLKKFWKSVSWKKKKKKSLQLIKRIIWKCDYYYISGSVSYLALVAVRFFKNKSFIF